MRIPYREVDAPGDTRGRDLRQQAWNEGHRSHERIRGREIAERVVGAGLNFVPGVGSALAVTFVTALNWKLSERRDERLGELAEAVQELGERLDGIDPRSYPTTRCS